MAWRKTLLIGGLMLCGTMSYTHAGDLREAAHKITVHELQVAGWEKYAQKALAEFETASADNGDMNRKRYLDDKLIALGTALGGKKVDEQDVRAFIYWMALYWEWNEPLPAQVQSAFDKHQVEIEAALEDFSWKKVQDRLVAYNSTAK